VAFGFLSLASLETLQVRGVQALGCRVVSSLKIMHFSPYFRRRRVNHRRRTRTWRQQVQSRAAPSCRHVRVERESTWLQDEEQGPGRTCRPRVTRWQWASFTTAAPPQSGQCFRPQAGTALHKRGPGSCNQAHNMPAPSAEQGSPTNANQLAVTAPFRASRPFSGPNQPTGATKKQKNKRRRRGRRQFLKCPEERNEEKTPSGWLCPDARNWLSFFVRSHHRRNRGE
jgi:hypothetical protein